MKSSLTPLSRLCYGIDMIRCVWPIKTDTLYFYGKSSKNSGIRWVVEGPVGDSRIHKYRMVSRKTLEPSIEVYEGRAYHDAWVLSHDITEQVLLPIKMLLNRQLL